MKKLMGILLLLMVVLILPQGLYAEKNDVPDLEDLSLQELENGTGDERVPNEDPLFLGKEEEVKAVPEFEVTQKALPPKVVAPPLEVKAVPKVFSESSLLNEENIYSGNAVYTGKQIELLELKDTDIREALRLIGKYSGYNIVIGDDVTGKMGILSLTKIPWDQAFALVLQSKKLGYVREGNVLRVATLLTLKAEKEEAAAAEQSRMRVEALKTMILPISYAKASEIAPRAKPMLSERGSIDVDERSNMVVVRDIDKVLQRVKKLFTALDTQPPRVTITAKVLEMTETLSRKFGFNFMGFNLHPTSGVSFDAAFTPMDKLADSVLIRAANFANLDAHFQLSELESETRVLASPTISVNQNTKGTIRQNVSFVRLVQGGISANGSQAGQQFQSVNAELLMEATPVVANDGSISINLHVKNDVPNAAFGKDNGGQIDTRDITTNLLLASGDTAVIGGVFKNSVATTSSGTPLLKHIPILGFFFSGETKDVLRSEILIFLTAKITNAEEVFKKTL